MAIITCVTCILFCPKLLGFLLGGNCVLHCSCFAHATIVLNWDENLKLRLRMGLSSASANASDTKVIAAAPPFYPRVSRENIPKLFEVEKVAENVHRYVTKGIRSIASWSYSP